MIKVRPVIFSLICLLIASSVSANVIDKGLEALSVKDFFKAKSYFVKGIKKHRVGAHYGLSLIHI